MKYEVNYYDPENGAWSPIDVIEGPEGYTAKQYISDCDTNADEWWWEMLHTEGSVIELIAVID